MLITSDFIFVHIPKTGGTFINKVVRDIYKPKRFGRAYNILNKLNVGRYCEHHTSSEPYPNLEGYPYGQHIGLRHIPETIKPVFHVKRAPEEYYRSLYFYGHYKKVPHLEQDVLNKEFPSFPDILPEELFKYYHLLTCKVLGQSDLKFGYLTYQIVDQLSPDIATRDKIFQCIQNDKVEEAVSILVTANPKMHILKLDTLNQDLELFFRKNTSIPKERLSAISENKKLNVSEKKENTGPSILGEDQKLYELFTYKYWGYL